MHGTRSPGRDSWRRRPSECSSGMKTRSWFEARPGGVLLERPAGRGPGLPMAARLPRCPTSRRLILMVLFLVLVLVLVLVGASACGVGKSDFERQAGDTG